MCWKDYNKPTGDGLSLLRAPISIGDSVDNATPQENGCQIARPQNFPAYPTTSIRPKLRQDYDSSRTPVVSADNNCIGPRNSDNLTLTLRMAQDSSSHVDFTTPLYGCFGHRQNSCAVCYSNKTTTTGDSRYDACGRTDAAACCAITARI
jgi:hypothetical protein